MNWYNNRVLPWALTVTATSVSTALFLAPHWSSAVPMVRWVLVATFTVGAAVAGFALTMALRRLAAIPLSSAAPVKGIPLPRPTPTSLDKALGAVHMRELRAHVDLLSTMSTLERMGPDLLEELKSSGVSTLAFQAAVAARAVRRILGDPALDEQLSRTGIEVNGEAIDVLREDLNAIAMALTALGQRLDNRHTGSMHLWPEEAVSSAPIGGLEPIDHLLLESTVLLSGVSDLARILATIHSRPLGTRTDGLDAALEIPDTRRFKLN